MNKYNYLEGYNNIVWSVIFYFEGNLIVFVSVDKIIKLWSRDGKL